MDAENACADRKEQEGTKRYRKKVMSRVAMCVEHASQLALRRSRVNFSREIEMDSLNQARRAPMSAEP